MDTCTFFGHSECYELDVSILKMTIEDLINKGIDTFYVGHNGNFDNLVFGALIDLQKIYPNISVTVVLAYLTTQNTKHDPYQGYTIYPEDVAEAPRRFAIDRRNRWMIEHSDFCICYITHTWGGAYKFVSLAKKKGLKITNLGEAKL